MIRAIGLYANLFGALIIYLGVKVKKRGAASFAALETAEDFEAHDAIAEASWPPGG